MSTTEDVDAPITVLDPTNAASFICDPNTRDKTRIILFSKEREIMPAYKKIVSAYKEEFIFVIAFPWKDSNNKDNAETVPVTNEGGLGGVLPESLGGGEHVIWSPSTFGVVTRPSLVAVNYLREGDLDVRVLDGKLSLRDKVFHFFRTPNQSQNEEKKEAFESNKNNAEKEVTMNGDESKRETVIPMTPTRNDYDSTEAYLSFPQVQKWLKTVQDWTTENPPPRVRKRRGDSRPGSGAVTPTQAAALTEAVRTALLRGSSTKYLYSDEKNKANTRKKAEWSPRARASLEEKWREARSGLLQSRKAEEGEEEKEQNDDKKESVAAEQNVKAEERDSAATKLNNGEEGKSAMTPPTFSKAKTSGNPSSNETPPKGQNSSPSSSSAIVEREHPPSSLLRETDTKTPLSNGSGSGGSSTKNKGRRFSFFRRLSTGSSGKQSSDEQEKHRQQEIERERRDSEDMHAQSKLLAFKGYTESSSPSSIASPRDASRQKKQMTKNKKVSHEVQVLQESLELLQKQHVELYQNNLSLERENEALRTAAAATTTPSVVQAPEHDDEDTENPLQSPLRSSAPNHTSPTAIVLKEDEDEDEETKTVVSTISAPETRTTRKQKEAIAALKEKLKKASATVVDKTNTIRSLQKEKEELNAKMTVELKAADRRYKDLETTLEAMRGEKLEIERQLATEIKKNREMGDDYTHAMSKLTEVEFTGKALKEELIALRSSNSNLRDRERHLRMEIVELKEREHEVHSELSRVRDHLRTSQGKEKVIEMELEREREEREKLWHRCRCQAATMLERQLRRRQTVPSDLVEARHRWTPRVEHRRTSSADAMRVSGTPKSRKGEKSAASTSSSHEKVDTAEVPVVDDVETTPMQLFVELLKKHYINALVLLMKYQMLLSGRQIVCESRDVCDVVLSDDNVDFTSESSVVASVEKAMCMRSDEGSSSE